MANVGWGFHPFEEWGGKLAPEYVSLIESLYVTIGTPKGERKMYPEFGTSFWEEYSNKSKDGMREAIMDGINQQGRVNLKDITFTYNKNGDMICRIDLEPLSPSDIDPFYITLGPLKEYHNSYEL